MKKLILTMLALPLMLVACSEEKFDRNLNGSWEGEMDTTDYQLLRTSNINLAAVKESVIYKFDDANLQTFRTKKANINDTNVEIETGTYERSDSKINYKINAHSCVDTEAKLGDEYKRPTNRPIIYALSKDQNTLTITLAIGKKISLTRLSKDDAGDYDHILGQSTTGCFVSGGKFEKSPVKKPKVAAAASDESLNDEAIVEDDQAAEEL